MTTATKKTAPIETIPIEEIEKLAAIHENVVIKILRRNDKGHLAMGYSGLRFRADELVNIDAWCFDHMGGGRFRIEVYQVDAPTQRPMAPFEFRVEGAPKPRVNLNAPVGVAPHGGGAPAPAPVPAPGNYMPPERYGVRPQPDASAWAAGLYDPAAASAFVAAQQAQQAQQAQSQPGAAGWVPPRYTRSQQGLPPGATVASDALALKQIAKLEAALAKAEAEAKARQKQLEHDLEQQREEARRQREKAAEERHASEIAALRSLIEAKSAEKSTSIPELIATLAPFVPVLQTLVSSKSDQSAKAIDAQMQGVQTLMQATLTQANNRPDMVATLTSLAPLLGPVVSKFFDQRAPEQQAALYQAMSEQNLNSVAMLAQLVEAMAPQDAQEQPWFGAIRDALGSVVNMTQAYMQGQGLPGQQPAPLPASGAMPAQIPAGGSSYGTPPGDASSSGADAAMFALLPTAYQTLEWRKVLEALHQTPQLDATTVATVLVKQLEHLIDFDMLPQELAALLTDPRATLEGILTVLPIAQRAPDYVRAVLDDTLGMLLEDGYLTPQGVESPVIAEPPPADAVVADQGAQ